MICIRLKAYHFYGGVFSRISYLAIAQLVKPELQTERLDYNQNTVLSAGLSALRNKSERLTFQSKKWHLTSSD